jgi:hypothetical protein
MTASDASALVFALNKEMNAEDIFKEFNQKVRTCTLPNKLIMQAMISIAMTYEALCATARATAAILSRLKIKKPLADNKWPRISKQNYRPQPPLQTIQILPSS